MGKVKMPLISSGGKKSEFSWIEKGTGASVNPYYGVTLYTTNDNPKEMYGGGYQGSFSSSYSYAHVAVIKGTTMFTVAGSSNYSSNKGEATVNLTFGANSVTIPYRSDYADIPPLDYIILG